MYNSEKYNKIHQNKYTRERYININKKAQKSKRFLNKYEYSIRNSSD